MPGVRYGLLETFAINSEGGINEALVQNRITAEDGRDLGFGRFQHVLEQQTNQQSFVPSYYLFSFVHDFYNRIYFLPNPLQFGTMAEQETQTFLVWNAFLDPVILTNFTTTDTAEVGILGPATPTTYQHLQAREYNATAFFTTEQTLSETGLFTFTTDDNPALVAELPISGNRSPDFNFDIYPFVHNWNSSFVVSYEFQTGIIVSANGSEQRRANRQTPRKRIEMASLLMNLEDSLLLQQIMTANQKGTFMVPEFSRYVTTTEDMNSLDDTVAIDQTPPWWAQRLNYVVLRHGRRVALRRISDLPENSNSTSDYNVLEFTTGDATAWPAGTRIHPAIRSWPQDSISVAAPSRYLTQAPMDFTAVPGEEPIETIPAATEFIDGREVWRKEPNWVSGVPIEMIWPTTFVDAGYGRVDRGYSIDHMRSRWRFNYTCRSHAEFEQVRHFFYRMKGRLGEFYIPDWRDEDPVAASGVTLGQSTLVVEGTLFGAYYFEVRTRGMLKIEFTDETIYKRISSIVLGTGGNLGKTIITFAEPFDATRPLVDIVGLEWFHLCRLSSDNLVAEWLTQTKCSTSLTFETLPDDQGSDIEDSNSSTA